jgi:hypothetical protein
MAKIGGGVLFTRTIEREIRIDMEEEEDTPVAFFYMKKKITVKEKDGTSGWFHVKEIGTCR